MEVAVCYGSIGGGIEVYRPALEASLHDCVYNCRSGIPNEDSCAGKGEISADGAILYSRRRIAPAVNPPAMKVGRITGDYASADHRAGIEAVDPTAKSISPSTGRVTIQNMTAGDGGTGITTVNAGALIIWSGIVVDQTIDDGETVNHRIGSLV